jgi:hypothetical protein
VTLTKRVQPAIDRLEHVIGESVDIGRRECGRARGRHDARGRSHSGCVCVGRRGLASSSVPPQYSWDWHGGGNRGRDNATIEHSRASIPHRCAELFLTRTARTDPRHRRAHRRMPLGAHSRGARLGGPPGTRGAIAPDACAARRELEVRAQMEAEMSHTARRSCSPGEDPRHRRAPKRRMEVSLLHSLGEAPHPRDGRPDHSAIISRLIAEISRTQRRRSACSSRMISFSGQ